MQSAGLAGVLGAIALTGIAPFVWTVHRYPLPELDSELVAALCLGFGLICCGLLERRPAELRWPLPVAMLFFTLAAWAQQMSGLLAYTQLEIRFALFLCTVLAAYVFGRRIVAARGTRDAIGALCGAILAGGLFSAAVQWLQMFGAEVLPSWLAILHLNESVQQRPPANLAQANHLATYLAMAALSTLYLRPRVQRFTWVAAALCVLACGLAMTGSRMVTLFVALIIVLLFAPSALRPTLIRDRWVASGALVAGYATGLIALRWVVGEFDVVTRFGADTLPIRFELWRQAWQIAWQHPWLGIGVGQFGYGQYWVARAGPYTYPASNCHNLILQLAAELGWPVALGAVALGLYWGLHDLRARLARPEHALALAMMLMILIHSMLEFPLWHLYFAIPAALLFAMAEPERGARFAHFGLRGFLPVWGLAMIVVALAFQLQYVAVSAAATRLLLASQNLRNATPYDVFSALAVADSELFMPEVDRLLLQLKHPPDESTSGPLQRSERFLHVLPAPDVIAQYVVQLARADRIDEATAHAARLRVFAGAGYDVYRDWILDRTRDLGPQTAPLRHALRESH